MTGTAPRWAISFADLGLLLLGCFVLLHAMEAAKPRSAPAAVAAASLGAVYPASGLFERGEARLTERGRAVVETLGRNSIGRDIEIVSVGTGEGGSRLDRFELAAARSAAVARSLRDSGVSEGGLKLSLEQSGSPSGQQIAIRVR